MVEPSVQDYSLNRLTLSFTLTNCSRSLANGLRRTIMADVPCVVLHAETSADDGPSFHVNTSRRTNEILAQRLACIPVHASDPMFPYQEYTYVIDKTNSSDSIEYITSEDITLRETKSGRDVAASEIRRIFPSDPTTGDFIDIVRLRPGLAKTMVGESLHVSGKLSLSTPGQNGCHALTSTCVCVGTRNKAEIDQALATLEKKLLSEGKPAEDIALAKSDFNHLDASRLTVPNSFDFVIQAIGPIQPRDLVHRGIDILVGRLRDLKLQLSTNTDRLQDAPGTMPNAFSIELHGDGYTLGGLITDHLYSQYYMPAPPILSFCGFRKPHPHIAVSTVKLAFTQETTRAGALAFMDGTIDELIAIVGSLAQFFRD